MTSERKSILPALQPAGRSRLRQLRNYLVAGALVLVPAFVTFWVFHRFVLSLEGVLLLVPEGWAVNGVVVRRFLASIPGLGALLTLAVLLGVGFLATNLAGRRIVHVYEAAIKRVPVLSTIYEGVKQLLEAIFSSKASRFSDVVYIEYPRRGMWSIGFVTGPTFASAREKIGRDCVNVFIPTTPNPTSGFYFLVPREDAISSGITVEQAFKLIMSAGMVEPTVIRADKA